jgi:hypothetical protein
MLHVMPLEFIHPLLAIAFLLICGVAMEIVLAGRRGH